MRALSAFTVKEFQGAFRSGKGMTAGLLFVIFGIMSPAAAKLTPWLMETMASSLAESGLDVTGVTVNGLTSWHQFCKNIPIAAILFLLIFSGVLTAEYEKGTLTAMVARGLARWKILAAKTAAVSLLWTAGYWLCFGITWGYTRYFWNDGSAQHVLAAAGCYYLLGLWLITLILLASAALDTGGAALAAAACVFALVYAAGLLPAVKGYLPGYLLGAQAMLSGQEAPGDYLTAALVTGGLCIADLAAAGLVFEKRTL